MPSGSVICRKSLDQERGNPWGCEGPMCTDGKGEKKEKPIIEPLGSSLEGVSEQELTGAMN